MFIRLHANGWNLMSGIFKEVEKDNNISPVFSYAHFNLMWDLCNWKKIKEISWLENRGKQQKEELVAQHRRGLC